MAGISNAPRTAPPKLQTYPRETVVAEKYEAMVRIGMANSRMKDFYDVFMLAREFEFDGATLSSAIRNTFSRRGTPLPEENATALMPEFYDDRQKALQWKAFCARGRLRDPGRSLKAVCEVLSLPDATHAGGQSKRSIRTTVACRRAMEIGLIVPRLASRVLLSE